MNNTATLEKLRDLKLRGMERAFTGIIEAAQPHAFTSDELVGHLVEAEYEDRQLRKTQRLTTAAAFRTKAAFPEIDFRAERGLDKATFMRLSDCGWIEQGKSIVICGPTGVGKSFLAQALGMQACQLGYRTLYFNCSKLFPLLALKRGEGGYQRLIHRIARTQVLILDDFGLLELDAQDRLALLEIIEDRYERAGTVIASQIPVNKWFNVIGDPTIGDAVCDRLIPQAIRISLTGKSMRLVKNGGKTDES